MIIHINPDGSVAVTMTPLQFVGIFRTIGATSSDERMTRSDIRLTLAESFAVTMAYQDSVSNEVFKDAIFSDRE